MTFFVQPLDPNTPAAPEPTGFTDRVKAGFNTTTIQTNAWNYRSRIEDEVLSDWSEAITGDAGAWRAGGRGLNRESRETRRAGLGVVLSGLESSRRGPSTANGLVLTEESFDAEVKARILAERSTYEEILRAAPDDAFAAETLGILARAATDEAALATGVAGLGLGAVARTGLAASIALEAGLGAAAEAATLPGQFAMADFLGTEDPDVAASLLMGAAGGALFPIAGAVVRGGAGAVDRALVARRQSQYGRGEIDPGVREGGLSAAQTAVERDQPEVVPDEPNVAASGFRRDASGVDARGADFDRTFNALIRQESNFNPNAESPAGALGLAQIMPATARSPGFGLPNVFEIARGLGRDVPDESDATLRRLLLDPEVNTQFGEGYFRAMLDRYDGDLDAALVAYNAGAGNADKWVAAGRDWSVLPKASETQPYVQRIRGFLDLPEDAGLGFSTAPRRFRAADLETEPGTYQWKESIDTEGRTGALEGRVWDEESSGLLIVHERVDGRRVVANGHERLALARAAGDDTPVNALVFREADGWDAQAINARTALAEFMQTRSDPDAATRQVLRSEAIREVRANNQEVFERVTRAEAALKDAQATIRQMDRPTPEDRGGGVFRPSRGEAEQAVESAAAELAAARAVQRDLIDTTLADMTAARPTNQMRRAPDGEGTRAAGEAEFVRGAFAELAEYVRGRVPSRDAGRLGDDVGGPNRPDTDPILEGRPEVLAAYSDPNGTAVQDASFDGLRDLEVEVRKEDFAVLFDGDSPVMASEVLADLQDDLDFLGALDACPVGRAAA